MDFQPLPSRSTRSGTHSESDEEDIPRPSGRRVPIVESYAEESEDEENINVGSGSLIDEHGSELEDQPEAEIRCICGATEEDDEDEDERDWIQCDNCNVWQHSECLGISSALAKATPNFLCSGCSPYGSTGAAMAPTEQPGFPIRSAWNKTTPKSARSKGNGIDVYSYYKSTPDLSVKRSAKAVSFSPDTRFTSEEYDDPENYIPSDEEASDGDDEQDYNNDLDEEGSSLFVSRSPTPEDSPSAIQLAKRPRAPGVSDLGVHLVRMWIDGGYAVEMDAENAAAEWGSDVSDVDIPDMSEGTDLLEKLGEQEKLIFSLKKKLQKRGIRVARLKQQVAGLERENSYLRGLE